MKILLVEDNKALAQSLQQSLRAECFEVDTAFDGEEGLFISRTNNYDLIIIDAVLPKKDGHTLCKEIRNQKNIAPIIFLSGESDIQSKIDALNLGADDYITKPFSLSELVARIRAVLRRPQQIQSSSISIDTLHLDLASQKVMRDQEAITLTRKEYMLLEYMMKNKGRVLSRGEIMEHVWDMNADPFSNTIEAHMLNLRKKIDAKPQKKLIHTLKGRGYKIDLDK